MDEYIIITAHHEAGHALTAYIVGWTINEIELNVKEGILQYGVTRYNYGVDKINNWTNLNRRILCLMGGPIAQKIYEKSNYINIDSLGQDGKSIDDLLSSLDRQRKEETIQNSIDKTATLLNTTENITARQLIVDKLINTSNYTS